MKSTISAVHTAMVAMMAIIALLGYADAVGVDRRQHYRGWRATTDVIKRSALPDRAMEATAIANSLTKRARFDPNGPPVRSPTQIVNLVDPQQIFTLGWLFRAGEGTDPNDPNGYPLLRFDIDQQDDGVVTAEDLEAVVDDMDASRDTGFRAVAGDDTWQAYANNDINIVVRFNLRGDTPELNLSNFVLQQFVFAARMHRAFRGRPDGVEVRGSTVITTAHVVIRITRGPFVDREVTQQDEFNGGNATDWAYASPWHSWTMGGDQDCAPRRRSLTSGPPEAPIVDIHHQAVVNNKRGTDKRCRKSGDANQRQSHGAASQIPRRANETVWIDPSTGWQAVQVSLAAKRFGYNISNSFDYVAVDPSDTISGWAQHIHDGGCATDDDKEAAAAGLIFGCKKPSKKECAYARAVLAGEHNSGSPDTPHSKRAPSCEETMIIKQNNAVSKATAEAGYLWVKNNMFSRLPNDWNSVKLSSGIYLSWSANAGCKKDPCPRFEGGAPPAYAETFTYFKTFIDTANWGWWLWPTWNSVRFHHAFFGEIDQGVCISDRAGGCHNNDD